MIKRVYNAVLNDNKTCLYSYNINDIFIVLSPHNQSMTLIVLNVVNIVLGLQVVTAVGWVPAKTRSELLTTSTDGQVGFVGFRWVSLGCVVLG